MTPADRSFLASREERQSGRHQLRWRDRNAALLNFMSNANKFTERGTISIDARQGQENGRDYVAIAVVDTGIGMTPEQMSKLFQEFSQADASTTRNTAAPGWASRSANGFVK